MDNGKLTANIIDKTTEVNELEELKRMFEESDKELERMVEVVRPLSEYSTTELKTELRRRKKERRY